VSDTVRVNSLVLWSPSIGASVAELEAELSQFVAANGREEPGDPLDVEPAMDP
jgi:hypothetical protein